MVLYIAFTFLLLYIYMYTIILHLLQYGSTALVSAASRGHTAIVQMLLSLPGIDVNLQNEVVLIFEPFCMEFP